MNLLWVIIFLLPFNVSSLETDQYMVWNQKLNDSTIELNNYFNENLLRSVDKINALGGGTCEQAIFESLKEYEVAWWGERIENWILENNKIQKFPDYLKTKRLDAIDQSIYKDVLKFKLKIFGYNIRVGNVNMGVDKIGHFTATGMTYYRSLLKFYDGKIPFDPSLILKSVEEGQRILSQDLKYGKELLNKVELAGINKVIFDGIFQETWYWGYAVSNTFSYGDLEANYQGLLFVLNFCYGNNPYLKEKSGKIYINSDRPIDVSEYMSPLFDESYNPSHYKKGIFKKLKPHLLNYCSVTNNPEVLELFNEYDQKLLKMGGKSYSSLILEYLQTIDKIKSPVTENQTLHQICKDPVISI